LSADLGQLVPELEPYARALVDAAGVAGLLPRVTSTRRSSAEQARLYRRSQQGLQKYPVAPPGRSAHEYGEAFDLIVSPFDWIDSVGQLWEQWGGVWGGRFGDEVHFELPGASQRAQERALSPADAPTSIPADIANFLYGYIPVLGQVQMAADLATLFPSLSHSETLAILASPSKYITYIRALMEAYR